MVPNTPTLPRPARCPGRARARAQPVSAARARDRREGTLGSSLAASRGGTLTGEEEERPAGADRDPPPDRADLQCVQRYGSW